MTLTTVQALEMDGYRRYLKALPAHYRNFHLSGNIVGPLDFDAIVNQGLTHRQLEFFVQYHKDVIGHAVPAQHKLAAWRSRLESTFRGTFNAHHRNVFLKYLGSGPAYPQRTPLHDFLRRARVTRERIVDNDPELNRYLPLPQQVPIVVQQDLNNYPHMERAYEARLERYARANPGGIMEGYDPRTADVFTALIPWNPDNPIPVDPQPIDIPGGGEVATLQHDDDLSWIPPMPGEDD